MSLFFTPLKQFVALAVQGEKAKSFLQGQLTCDINDISLQQSRMGAHCNLKGRILVSMRVVLFKQQFYLLLPRDNAEFAIQQLRKYAQLSRVTLSIASDMALIGCWGEELANQPQFSQLPGEADQTFSTEQWLMVRERSELPRIILLGLESELEHLTTNFNLATEEDWKLLDIHNRVAHIFSSTRDLFTPHMLDYPKYNAVSFKKGCYIGQEIIARTQYLGKAKRHLQLAHIPITRITQPGEKIVNAGQQEVGVVIEAIVKDKQQMVLAVIQDEATSQPMYCAESHLVVYSHSS